MKRNLQIILTATTASFITLTALAQDTTTPRSDRTVYARQGPNTVNTNRFHSTAKAGDILGMTVHNYQDEVLGSVEDLAVDLESGRIVQVILSTGGFVGVGDRLSAVPPGALHHDAAKKVLHLDANKEKLKGAPEFNTSKWTEHFDSEHLSAVYTYYAQEPVSRFIHSGNAADRTGNRTNALDAPNAANSPNSVNRARTADTANTQGTRNADGTWNRSRLAGEDQWMIPASRLGQIQKASKVMGMAVKNRQDEKVGKVDNMLVDVQSGRILAIVVSSGGFLGLGDELSAVPPTAFSFNTERDALQFDTSKDALSAAPHFKSDQWPDFNQPAYSESIYRAHKVDPYFSTDRVTDANKTVKDADNTARNVRDRDNRTVTPLDQGNSRADTETTAEIRKGILAGKDMSLNARNVKIITTNGRVTLRGPVKSEEEKRLIGEIASRIARSENVDNQLEVTLKTSSN